MVDWSKRVRGHFRKVKGVEFADSTHVSRHWESLDRLLRTMADIAEEDWTFASVFVSDQSSVGDFLVELRDVAVLAQVLGFKVDRRDYLIDVAIRLERKQ